MTKTEKILTIWALLSVLIIISISLIMWDNWKEYKWGKYRIIQTSEDIFQRREIEYKLSLDSLAKVQNRLVLVGMAYKDSINELRKRKVSVSNKYKPKYEEIKNANADYLLNEFKRIFAADTINR